MKMITSFSNPTVKELVKLRQSRARAASGLTIVDGVRETRAAMEAGVEIRDIFVCPKLFPQEDELKNDAEKLMSAWVRQKGAATELTADVFSKISFGERAEGLLAVAKPVRLGINELRLKKVPLLMVVEGVEKPGNLGAILRTCDAAGADALLVSGAVTDIYNPNVIRASLGTVFHVPTVVDSAGNILAYLKAKAIKPVAAVPSAKKVYSSADLTSAVAIVIGCEKKGLSPFWLDAIEAKLSIPMKGRADSLNTSVAAALFLYEALRQRDQVPGGRNQPHKREEGR